uniref:Potassium channel toxin kappa-KTx 2.6 n=1 Tax=Opisthacanthus cayaporum TaxID=573324 RepID=KKX26_OPICY
MKTSKMICAFLLVLVVGTFNDISGAYGEYVEDQHSFKIERRFPPCVEVCVQHTGNVKECEAACGE